VDRSSISGISSQSVHTLLKYGWVRYSRSFTESQKSRNRHCTSSSDQRADERERGIKAKSTASLSRLDIDLTIAANVNLPLGRERLVSVGFEVQVGSRLLDALSNGLEGELGGEALGERKGIANSEINRTLVEIVLQHDEAGRVISKKWRVHQMRLTQCP